MKEPVFDGDRFYYEHTGETLAAKYESPIAIFYDAAEIITKAAIAGEENAVVEAVGKIGIKVNRDELIKALAYDRGQYFRGYCDAKMDSLRKGARPFSVIDKETGNEADTYQIALHEKWAKGLIYCDIDGFAIMENGDLVLLDECGRVAYCPPDRFEVRFEEESEE